MARCDGKLPDSVVPPVPRIVVIGDIHGDWSALKSSLKAAQVTNRHDDWVGAGTHLVQVGDLIDRGVRGSGGGDERSEKRIITHLLDLKKKAQAAGGDVHLLLGNHELMNVMGDFRYVSPLGMTDFDGQRKQQFAPGGRMAVEMACNMNSAVKIGSWVFSHAGVTNQIAQKYTINQANQHIREFLLGQRAMDREHPLMDMFWNRNYNGSTTSCARAKDSLSQWQAKNMAIGHTVQEHGIKSSCKESLWHVDIGSSRAFGKQLKRDKRCYIEVLEILNDGDQINVLRGHRACKRS